MTRKPFPDIMRTSCGKREREVNTVENQESIYEEKQGNLLTGSRACTTAPKAVESQNRKKKYILAEGTVIPPLADMGVMASNGAVHKAM